jgi:hypothetical protein
LLLDVSTFESITPAPVFAVRAFKQVLFGTPQPTTPRPIFTSNTDKPRDASVTRPKEANGRVQRRQLRPSEAQSRRLKQQDDVNASIAGDLRQRPQGILMTPGTAVSRRKQVKFGRQVLDNESKRSKYSSSGLPDNFPGKFPSPWTPKVAPAATAGPATHSREIIADNPNPRGAPRPDSPPRSKDDADITLDLSLPRSASGRYWKDQYDSYSAKSESEVKRLIIKQRVAKDYARIKDEEAMGLKSQLDMEHRKRQKRENSLERQVKDMRERLRAALADNAKMSAEVSSLRAELAGLSMDANDDLARSRAVASAYVPAELPTRSPEGNRLRRRPNFSAIGLDLDDIWLDDDADCEDNKRTRPPRRPRSSASRTPEKAGASLDFIPRLKRNTANSPLTARSPNIGSATTRPKADDVVVIRTLRGKSAPDVSVGRLLNDVPSVDELRHEPTTPLGLARTRPARTPDSRRLDGKRLDDAKARVAARRRRRENRAGSR